MLTDAASVPTFHGCPVFAGGGAYNSDVTSSAVEPNSSNYVDSMYTHGANQGFAVYVVKPAALVTNLASNSTKTYPVHTEPWHLKDFPAPIPFADSFFIEPQSDKHAVVVNTSTCTLYEMYGASFNGRTLSAFSGWEWDMRDQFVGTSATTPPAGTSNPSSTASGLSLFAGAFRSGDLAVGGIYHALDFGVPEGSISCTAIVWPATSTGGCGGHKAPSSWAVPYGARFRLKSTFNLTCGSSCPQAQMIVRAMKTYGLVISDTGGRGTGLQLWVMPENSGTNSFSSSDINHISQVKITDLEMLKP